MGETAGGTGDVWARWLLGDRHAGDAALKDRIEADVSRYIERVLDGADLRSGMTLLDLGAGDGAVALRALDRLGDNGRVILTDVSQPLLDHARARLARAGAGTRAAFLRLAADRLTAIAAESVDAVTSRAVLAYVGDRPAAFAEALRVLKPGGTLSIAEPVFRDEAELALLLAARVAAGAGAREPLLPLYARWKAAQFPSTPQAIAAAPITSFGERDLLALAQRAGFTDLHLEFCIDVRAAPPQSWASYTGTSPHPLAPSLATIMAREFSADERALLEANLRPAVEAGGLPQTDRIAYLTARRPPRPAPRA
jgi:arsenite methyltransferase